MLMKRKRYGNLFKAMLISILGPNASNIKKKVFKSPKCFGVQVSTFTWKCWTLIVVMVIIQPWIALDVPKKTIPAVKLFGVKCTVEPIQRAKQKDESTVWPGFPVLHNAHFLSFAASVCLPAWLCLPVTHQHLGGDLHTQRGRKSRFECASAMEGASMVLKRQTKTRDHQAVSVKPAIHSERHHAW